MAGPPTAQGAQHNKRFAAESLVELWREFVGIGCFLLGSVFAYAVHFQRWRWAQFASIAGVALFLAGLVLLVTAFSKRATNAFRRASAAGVSADPEMRETEQNTQSESDKWLIRLTLVAAIGMGVVILYAVQYQHWVLQRVASCIGIGLMTAGAAWLTGALLGFIFGVPHTRENAPNEDRYRPGTSLEEISDWLTKMIVGVSLTQLSNIPGKLSALATYIAQGMLSNAAGTGYSDLHALEVNRSFVLAVCIYFSVDGFLFGFLWARLYLLRAYRDADLAKEVRKDARKAQDSAMAADMTYQVFKARDLYSSIQDLKASIAALRTDNADNEERENKEKELQIRRYEVKEFIEKLKKYLPIFTTSRPLHIVLANLYDEDEQWETAVHILRQFISHREKTNQTNDGDVATAWFNLACMYTEGAQAASEGKKKELLDQAGEYLRNCLQNASASGPMTLAIQLYRAQKDPDLDALRTAGIAGPVLANFATTQATSS
jgi:MFS family permease